MTRAISERQSLPRQGKRVRIFIGEAEQWQSKPLYRAIVELAQQQGIRGATVIRGIEGFGPERHLSTERLPYIADNLPLIVEIVESAEQVEVLLPLLDRIVQHGMITVAPLKSSIVGGSAHVSCHQGQSSGQYGHRLYTLFSLAFQDVPMKRTRPTLSASKGVVVC